jgi:hypothetical protein
MVRKDDRGVVFPAPLQFNNPASARLPRVDDGHRGPAVADAYKLSRCWIDLLEHAQAWPMPTNLPPDMVELAQTVPEDQRHDWLRRFANMEEAERLISYEIRSGGLPIWVAPIGEADRPVDSSAILEIDRATLSAGTYRPPNDSGWLKGMPLFVKKDDWVHFIAKVQAERAESSVDPKQFLPGKDDMARALFGPLPAALPDIGTVMGLAEALSWLAHGRPSYDIAIWQNAAGDLQFRDPEGAVVKSRIDGALPPSVAMHCQASRTIHGALRDGNLPAYVAPETGATLQVSRFYWNTVDPVNLHLVYKGVTSGDKGAGCPVLVSRQLFDTWRAAIPALKTPEQPRPTHDEIVNWCKCWIESGKGNGMDKAWRHFHAAPEHHGLSRDDVFRPAWNAAKRR